MRNVRVAVIMSTYNGERYIREQIESILEQKNVHVDLFIRDDGSEDTTIDIIEEYKKKYSNIYLDKGKNIGFRKSFMTELQKVEKYEYYAFSDQDDFWEKEKLFEACKKIEKIKNNNIPIVYYSNLKVSDENLNPYKITKLDKRKKNLIGVTMRRSIAGCTMVFNHAMWKYIMKKNVTIDMLARGHDSFIMSLCYAIGGEVICDKNAYIRYRQHINNTSGSSKSLKQRLKKEYRNLMEKKGLESLIANGILENWSEDISKKNKKILGTVMKCRSNILTRIFMFISPQYSTGNLALTLFGKLKILFGFF